MAAPLTDAVDLERFGYRQELKRSLGFRDLVIYGLIYMVAIAPMGIFGSVFQASGGMVALAYGFGLVAMLVTASSYGVMVRAYPVAGSVYSYAGRAVAPWLGFLAGWTILLDYVLVPGLLSLIAAVSMASVLPQLPVWAWIVVFVAVNTLLNLFGIKTTKLLNRVFLTGQLVVLALYLVVGVAALIAGRGRGFSLDPIFSSSQFQLGVLLSAASVATLSFLGFDAMAVLAEDAKGGARQVGRAMSTALGLTGLLFIVQTFVAALLVPDPQRLITEGDPAGTAFYDTARVAVGGGSWLATLTAVATALAWGLSNNMVAQVATSRLLYAMARDRQLPSFLARVSLRRSVPTNGILLTAAISLVLGLFMAARADGITVLASLVNFGAVLSFIVLHFAVVYRWATRRTRTGADAVGGLVRNLLVPLTGMTILIGIAVHANILAQRLGLLWLGIGLLVLLALAAGGRSLRLAGIDTATDEPATHVRAGSHG